MQKPIIAILALSAGMMLAITATPAASKGTSAALKGNEGKGRYYFRQTCKSCHTKGAVGGEITPLNKSMAQWRTFFDKGTHNKGKEPLTKILSAQQLADVQKFLVNHAADSLQPETCGKD